MSELGPEEQLAAIAAAVAALAARARKRSSQPIQQDETRWRFQNRWWLQGVLSLRQRPRPTP